MSDVIKCINPATLMEFGEVPITDPRKVVELVTKAKAAHPVWARMSFKQRAKYLLKAREYLLANIDSFAKSITEDNGKPLTEAITAEIYPVAELIYYFAKNTEKLLSPQKIPLGIWHLLLRTSYVRYQPFGVVGIISPWNFPFSIPVGSVVMALMAGNCVLLKPSSSTAHVGTRIEELFNACDLPEHTFIHLPGTSRTGETLLEAPVNKIFFTGSSQVGHEIMNVCSRRLIPCNLELGGKDPLIVLKDANLKHAADMTVWGAFTNAGQCCASIERVYVHKDIADEFIQLVIERVAKLKIGNGLEPETDIGPLTTEAQLRTVEKQVDDARSRGAKILTGGERVPSLIGYFYKPTVITNVDHSFECVNEETFGPVLPVMTFEDENQVVRLANDTPYGLSAYISSKNISKARSIAEKLRAGTVVVNECLYTHALPQTPWGGLRSSGFGRTHGELGLKEMCDPHHIHVNRLTYFKDIWWYPYNRRLYKIFRKLARLMTGGLFGKIRALPLFLTTMIRK